MAEVTKARAPEREAVRMSRGRLPDHPAAAGLLMMFGQAGNHAAATALGSRRSLVIQRKCACSGDASPCHCDQTDDDDLQLQPKLLINKPGDQYEVEADSMADQVMRMTGRHESEPGWTAPVPRLDIQRHPAMPSGPHGPAVNRLGARLAAARGEGRPLDSAARTPLERQFGTDFRDVRVHTGATAAELSDDLHAMAFTHGRDIYFARGMFAPASQQGRRLLAHELTHVVQQRGHCAGRSLVQRQHTEDEPAATTASQPAGDPIVIHIHFPGFIWFTHEDGRYLVRIQADWLAHEIYGVSREEAEQLYRQGRRPRHPESVTPRCPLC